MSWLDLVTSATFGIVGGVIVAHLTHLRSLSASTEKIDSCEEPEPVDDPWTQIEYEEGVFVDDSVLTGDSDQAKLDKLVADIADSIRSRCKEGIVQSRAAKYDEDNGVTMSFLIRFNNGTSATYSCGWVSDTWELAKLSFESVTWYHTLLDHLSQEAIEHISFAIERGQSST